MLNELLIKYKQKRKKELETLKAEKTVVAGYYCLYTPVEIIEACGAVPVRIMDNGSYDDEVKGGRYLKSDSCSFCKATLGNLTGNNSFTCIISGNTCDQIRRIHEIIYSKIGIPVFLFSNPRTYGKDSTTQMFRSEIDWIIKELTNLTGVEFSEKKLIERLKKWNQLREFLLKVHNSRKRELPNLSGTEMFNLTDTAYFMGPDSFLPLIPEIEKILEKKTKFHNQTVRIFLAGSICTSDDRLIHELIEENGNAVIISDLICTGVRWFYHSIQMGGNIFENVCDFYHLMMICPHRRPNYPLYDFAKEQIIGWRPDGIIFRTLKFCHPWTFEVKSFKDNFDLPFLHLDTDYSNSNIGQLRTRIHAFIEMITAKNKMQIYENNHK